MFSLTTPARAFHERALHLEAGQSRHLEIEDEAVGLALAECIQEFLARCVH